MKAGETSEPRGENSLARKLMGWEPKVPLRDGVKLIFDRMLTSR